jgi:hypothetical protein
LFLLSNIQSIPKRSNLLFLFMDQDSAALPVPRFWRAVSHNSLLNVGRYHLRTWLQEPPHNGEVYETLNGICAFDVARLDRAQFAAWRSDVCTYHERHSRTTMIYPAILRINCRFAGLPRNQKP